MLNIPKNILHSTKNVYPLIYQIFDTFFKLNSYIYIL